MKKLRRKYDNRESGAATSRRDSFNYEREGTLERELKNMLAGTVSEVMLFDRKATCSSKLSEEVPFITINGKGRVEEVKQEYVQVPIVNVTPIQVKRMVSKKKPE